ncbi:MAG: ABC transporter permease [Elusimicrobia bacterium]|nr:ABC transporter permease [Elusimicrobiota bacterium]
MNMRAIAALWSRELLRFFRDRARVVGALAPPVVFWFLIGSGLGNAFKMPGAAAGVDFLQYFFSGTLVLIVLFTSVFATISIIEDRREGFLQAVLVAPITRLSIVLGKVLGAATVGLIQGSFFLVLTPLSGIDLPLQGFLWAATAMALASLGLTGLGFCIAWKMDSTQGFHAVMNLFLIPMWMLSGALFPHSTAPGWLRFVMSANPVSYAVSALQHSFGMGSVALASLPLCLLVLTGFSVATLGACVWLARDQD